MISQTLVFLLMLDAAWVAIGLARKKNMWKWIVLYWLILTVKNAVDALGSVM
ncbi:MAG: hypothetical protein IKS52_04625 [Clostridia bacterium]|nr:hypothetical protein [Clostridia bacterium]